MTRSQLNNTSENEMTNLGETAAVEKIKERMLRRIAEIANEENVDLSVAHMATKIALNNLICAKQGKPPTYVKPKGRNKDPHLVKAHEIAARLLRKAA
jgi:hypothetical protein